MNAKTVELHLLQSFPPSCVNRDGNNSPKDCTFGDVRRARISSQCLKRAIRESSVFEETAGKKAARSRWWVDELAKDSRLTETDDRALLITLMAGLIGGIEEEGEDADESAAASVASPADNQDDGGVTLRSKVLLHLPRTAGDGIIPVLVKHRKLLKQYCEQEEKIKSMAAENGTKKPKNPHKKDFEKAVKELVKAVQKLPPAPDIALYGRMLANNLGLNVDAAAQVAHAISTHKLSQEMDYWTAVDDFQPKADPGAGMLGTAEFNASVFYRYACLNLPALGTNLNERNEKQEWLNPAKETKNTVKAFLLASYDAIPTGKLNCHAHYNAPLFALAVVRKKGMPLNLSNAFLDPVRARTGNGLGAMSAEALLEQLAHTRCMALVDDASHFCAYDLVSDPRAQLVQRLQKAVETLRKGKKLQQKKPKGADSEDPQIKRIERRIEKLNDIQEVDGYQILVQKVMEELE
jgi:CRISPR system Cascade subunit CasC